MLRRFGLLAWLALGPLGVAYLVDPVLGAGLTGHAMVLLAAWFVVSVVLMGAPPEAIRPPAGRARRAP
jgi:hypothetical protein